MTHSSQPCRSTAVTLQRVGQEVILYDQRHGRAHVINASAAQVWDLCDGHAPLDKIVAAFARCYDMPEDAVRDDVASIIATFEQLGLFAQNETPAGIDDVVSR